jgi:hypothetical protein
MPPIIDPPRAIRVRTSTGWADLVIQGANGVGVPAAGSTGQVLAKKTATDYDTQWVPPPASTDIRYDGDWVPGSYTDGDIVIYNGVAYLCQRPTSAAPVPWATSGSPTEVAYAEAAGDAVGNGTVIATVTFNADGVSVYSAHMYAASMGGPTAGNGYGTNIVVDGVSSVVSQWHSPGGGYRIVPGTQIKRLGVLSAGSHTITWRNDTSGGGTTYSGSAGGLGGGNVEKAYLRIERLTQ